MSETVVKVEGLHKKFCRHLKRSMFYGALDVARNMMGVNTDSSYLRKSEFWALKDVNCELRTGETLGIIGINGSGKSTLLRMITGIFTPDMGRIEVRGRISSLIAVGAGFHPHMTGRENIYLNGIILGMSRKEIDRKFDQIVDFSEIEDFLEAPVATYSSGMKVKLGFSIAMFCEPDILLVDEVLSVGDLSFRNKSLRQMAEYRKKANAIIFVSHSLEQVSKLCNRVIVLNKGELVYDGETYGGCAEYERLTRELRLGSHSGSHEVASGLVSTLEGYRSDFMAITGFGICDDNSVPLNEVPMHNNLNFYCDFEVRKNIGEIYVTLSVLDEQWTRNLIRVVSNDYNKFRFTGLKAGKYRIYTSMEEHHLSPGLYYPHIAIRDADSMETFDRVRTDSPFIVTSEAGIVDRGSVIHVEEKWKMEKLD